MTSPGPVSKQELRKFGMIFGSLVIALFGLLIPVLVGSLLQKLWPWYLGGVVILLALLWPTLLKPLYHVWMKFGELAGWISFALVTLCLATSGLVFLRGALRALGSGTANMDLLVDVILGH